MGAGGAGDHNHVGFFFPQKLWNRGVSWLPVVSLESASFAWTGIKSPDQFKTGLEMEGAGMGENMGSRRKFPVITYSDPAQTKDHDGISTGLFSQLPSVPSRFRLGIDKKIMGYRVSA